VEKRQEKIRKVFREATDRKPGEHRFEEMEQISEKKKMHEIGG